MKALKGRFGCIMSENSKMQHIALFSEANLGVLHKVPSHSKGMPVQGSYIYARSLDEPHKTRSNIYVTKYL